MAACRQLGFDVTGNSAIRSANPDNPNLELNMKRIESPVAQIRPFKIFKDGGRPPGFDVTRNSDIRSADPETLP